MTSPTTNPEPVDDHGRMTEDAVDAACVNALLADFIVRAPKFKVPGVGPKEAADLLIPFGETLFVIQVKSRRLPAGTKQLTGRERSELEGRIDHAVRQVGSILETLKSGRLRHVRTKRGLQIPFKSEKYRRVVGVVVLEIQPADGAPGIERDIEILGGFAVRSGIPVHTFLRRDFDVLLRELDTPQDLGEYLNARERLLASRSLVPPYLELDLLGTFLARHALVEQVLATPKKLLVIEEGFWKTVHETHQADIVERERRRGESRIVDIIIEETHKCIGHDPDRERTSGVPYLRAASVEDYIEILDQLSQLRRIERIALGRKILEKARKADNNERGYTYGGMMVAGADTCFIFVASRQPREERIATVRDVAFAAYIALRPRVVVAIGLVNWSANGGSTDFMLMRDLVVPQDPELRCAAEAMFNRSRCSEDEWGNTYACGDAESA